MTYLLDTNTWIAYLRRKHPGVVQRIQQDPTDVALCSVVLAELLYGAYHSGAANQAANLALVAQIQGQVDSLPFDDKAAEEAGKTRAHLARLGTPIGPHDLMIAAIALANQLILVTHNTNEFSRVPGLKLEDWQTP